MAVEVVIPEVGEVGMEVTFVTWYRHEGDEVTKGEPLFQVDTQKTLFDVEAIASGRLLGLRAKPGELVEPRQVVATILPPGETSEPVPEAVPPGDMAGSEDPPTAPARTAPASAVASRRGRPAASPRAKAIATKLGVSLELVEGSGPEGLVTEADVRQAADSVPRTPTPAVDRANRIRRAAAALTIRSWAEVPHFYVRQDADITAGLERAKPLPLVVGAFARALMDRPECHVAWTSDGGITTRSTVTAGILVDAPDGLLLPAVHGVEHLGREGLTAAIAAAADRARAGRLVADDFTSRSVTVSNLGMFAVDEFAGIVATPDPYLLSIGRATTRPRWDGASWKPRVVATLVLSVDHRIVDGADAGRLMTALEDRLAEPDWLE
jgi:pyruvate dehydrogenase E2 component (dihydrolipoyllysine-residue acetyltransferase)